MGFIRGGLLVIASVLLFFSLLALNFSGILSSSLQYDNFEPEAISVIHGFLKSDSNVTNYAQNISPIIELYCNNNSDYVFSYEGYTFDIPCDKAREGNDAIIDEVVKDLIYGIYNTDYSCTFLECFKESKVPLFLASKKSYDYWNSKFYFMFIISLILLIAIFLLAEKKTNTFILSGGLLVISSLLFLKLDFWLSLISNKMISQFIGIFFSQAFLFSAGTLIAGILLLILGIIFKIFKIGFSISKFIEKIKGKGKDNLPAKKEEKTVKKSKSK